MRFLTGISPINTNVCPWVHDSNKDHNFRNSKSGFFDFRNSKYFGSIAYIGSVESFLFNLVQHDLKKSHLYSI